MRIQVDRSTPNGGCITVIMTTDLIGHSYICNLTKQQITERLAFTVTTLIESALRGPKRIRE